MYQYGKQNKLVFHRETGLSFIEEMKRNSCTKTLVGV